jgi:hypothetical protein
MMKLESTFPLLLKRADELIKNNHPFLKMDDEVYFLGEYTVGALSEHSKINKLILNYKKPFKKIYAKLCSFTLIRQANSGSDDSRVGVSPTTSERGSVSKADFTELLDRPFVFGAVRKCAASAVRNFLLMRLQSDHTCLFRFLSGRDKVTWPSFPSGISLRVEGIFSEKRKYLRPITRAAAE